MAHVRTHRVPTCTVFPIKGNVGIRARVGALVAAALLLTGCGSARGSGADGLDAQAALHDNSPVEDVGDAGEDEVAPTTTALETFAFDDSGIMDTSDCPNQIGVEKLFGAEVALTDPTDWECTYHLYGESNEDILGTVTVKQLNVQGTGWYTIQDFKDLNGDTLTYTDRPDYGDGAVEGTPPDGWPGDPVWVLMATPAGPAVEIEVSSAKDRTDVWMDAMVEWVEASW